MHLCHVMIKSRKLKDNHARVISSSRLACSVTQNLIKIFFNVLMLDSKILYVRLSCQHD